MQKQMEIHSVQNNTSSTDRSNFVISGDNFSWAFGQKLLYLCPRMLMSKTMF